MGTERSYTAAIDSSKFKTPIYLRAFGVLDRDNKHVVLYKQCSKEEYNDTINKLVDDKFEIADIKVVD